MSNMTFDTNVPIPEKSTTSGRKSWRSKFSFLAELNTNESVFIPEREMKITSVSGAVHRYQKKLDRKFVTRRRIENGLYGIRIWRTS